MLCWSQVIKRIKLYLGLLICPDWWPNRSSFVKLEALFKNKLSKKALKNVFSVILTLSKSLAQSEAQTRETDDSDPNNSITRYVGSDPIFGRIRIPNSGNRFNRVEFSLGPKPTRPDPWTPLIVASSPSFFHCHTLGGDLYPNTTHTYSKCRECFGAWKVLRICQKKPLRLGRCNRAVLRDLKIKLVKTRLREVR